MKHQSRLRRCWFRSPNPPQSRPNPSTTQRTERSQSATVNANAIDQVSSSPTRESSTPSLWKKAYERLDSDLVEQFNELLHQEGQTLEGFESGPKDPTRDDVDRICHNGQRRMEQAESTFRFNNKEHKVHDAFVKGIAVITWAKDLVSTAIDKASSPETSLVWAATILVLPLFENIDTVREANKTGFTYVGASMQFYVALETTFRSLGAPVPQDLVDATEESIVNLYRNILTFQLLSAIRFHRKKFKNKIRDMVDYDGWKTLLQGVKDAENLVNQRWELLQSTVGLDSLHNQREEAARTFQILQKHLEELSNISQNTNEITLMMKKAEARALSEAEQKHLQSLRHYNATQDQSYELAKYRTEKRVEGTCEWLLADKQYQAWLRTDAGLLVISADPGCGKSVLSRYLIEEGLPRDDLTICYFFFKDEDQDRVHLALCALLHQLLVSKPFLITKYLATEHSKNGESLKTNVAVLWGVFENALRDTQTGRVVIVVDGLDECQPGELGEFCNKVNSLFSDEDSTQQTRFIVTTRPYPQITSLFNAAHIRVAGELESGTIREEVKLVIQHRVETLRKMPEIIPGALLPRLREKLLSVDHPTYLWAALTFKFIESGKFKKTNRGLQEAVERLPRTINEAYEKILRKTDPEDEAIIRRALTIVLGAKRPMSVDEMNVAINLAPDMASLAELDLENEDVFATSLRNWTGLFITIYNHHVYFIHQTVREFLVGDNSSSARDSRELGHWHGTFSSSETNNMLAGIFLRYIPLCYDNFDPMAFLAIPMTTPIASMYMLAVDCVRFHLTDDIGDEITKLALHVLTHFGRDWTLPLDDAQESGTEYERALLLAVWNGMVTIVVYLLSLPDVHLECCDRRGRTPLVLAMLGAMSWFGRGRPAHSHIVSALLEAGANPNPRLCQRSDAPIYSAILLQDSSVVRKLIAHGADVNGVAGDTYNTPSDATYTPLHQAVIRGADEMVTELLLAGANIQARTPLGMTPLHLAVEASFVSTTSLLLAHGADVNSGNDYGQRPLDLANVKQIAIMLIRASADIDIEWDSSMILHRAVDSNQSDDIIDAI